MASDRVRWVRLDKDLDRPLHRISLIGRIEELCRSGQMAILQPSMGATRARIRAPGSC